MKEKEAVQMIGYLERFNTLFPPTREDVSNFYLCFDDYGEWVLYCTDWYLMTRKSVELLVKAFQKIVKFDFVLLHPVSVGLMEGKNNFI